MRTFVLLLGCCFAASPVAAEETRLVGEAITTTLSGSVLALDTPVGSTVEVRIGHDGMMAGDAGTALGSVLGAPKDRGRWWVLNDRVCFKWFRWFDAEPRCATISVEGKHLAWRRDDGDTGTATIVEQDKPIAKSAVIGAEAKKPAAHVRKQIEKKAEVVLAADEPKAGNPPNMEEKPSITNYKPRIATVPQVEGTTTLALNIPPPRPAVRPQHHDEIAVAAVKPQFFASTKVKAAKVQPAKVEIAKAQTSKIVRKPFRVAGVEPTDVLNIRTGPSSDYQTVGVIPPNSHGITVTGPCLNDWCPVKHGALVGWVNRRYLAEETAANTAAVSETNYWNPSP